MAQTAQMPDYSPRSFIEQSQVDADQKTHDVHASVLDVSALYACIETRGFVEANYGTLKTAQAILGNILHHMEQTELTKRRVA